MRKSLLVALVCLSYSYANAKPAPSFSGDMLGGGRTTLAKALKEAETSKKFLLLSFWATWCTPCMQELKVITDKLNTDKNFPLSVLTVNVDTSETTSDVKPTLKLYKFDFPVVMDPKHEIFSKYQDSKNLPFSVLVNANGQIAATFSGYDENMLARVGEIIGGKTNAK